MKISELIDELMALKNKHGDIIACVANFDFAKGAQQLKEVTDVGMIGGDFKLNQLGVDLIVME